MRDFRKHLELAERHIAQAKEDIAAQLDRLAELKRRGEDTREGEKLLVALLDGLAAYEAHQRTVLKELTSTAPASGEDPKKKPRS